jgi:hypothetical protein
MVTREIDPSYRLMDFFGCLLQLLVQCVTLQVSLPGVRVKLARPLWRETAEVCAET